MVCKLEEPMRKTKELKDKYNQNLRTQGCLSSCSTASCFVQACPMKMKHNRKTFQIAWVRGSNEYVGNLPTKRVKVSHLLYAVLRGEYGLPPHNCRRKRDDNELDDLEDM